jgi:hypothetical protein
MLLMRYKWLLAGIRKPNWIFLRSFHGKSDPQLLHILAKSIPRGTNLLYLVPNMRKRDILSSFSLRSISARFGSRTIPVSSNSVPWEKVVEKFLKHHAVPIVDTSHIGSKGLKHEVKKVGDDTLEQPVLWLVDRKLMLPAFKLIELTEIHEYKLEYILCYQDTIIGRFLGIVIQFIWIGIVLIILFFTAKGVISDTELNILLSIALSFIAIFIVYNLFTPSTNYIFHKKLRRLLHVIRKRYTGNECWER